MMRASQIKFIMQNVALALSLPALLISIKLVLASDLSKVAASTNQDLRIASQHESSLSSLESLDASQVDAEWIETEYGLQFRVRSEQYKAGESVSKYAYPLFYVDLRMKGKERLDEEIHHLRHQIIVDDVEYERNNQQRVGFESIPENDKMVSIPFLLSPGWRDISNNGKNQLKLGVGEHTIKIKLHFLWDSVEEVVKKQFQSIDDRTLVTKPIEFRIVRPSNKPDTKELALENLRREMIVFSYFYTSKLTLNLDHLIRAHQPSSGNYLLSLLEASNDFVIKPASLAIASTWNSFSHSQLERYFRLSMSHSVRQRKKYPEGINAGIEVGSHFKPGYSGLPKGNSKFIVRTMTKHYLDGKRVEKLYKYNSHTSTSHWFRTGNLTLGSHIFHMITYYEFRRRNELYAGSVESPKYEFEIVADVTDDLRAPADDVLDNQVRDSMSIEETELRREPWITIGSEPIAFGAEIDYWKPQITWENLETGDSGSLHAPLWELKKPLPVDLCFETKIKIGGTDEVVQGSDLIILAGDARSSYFIPDYAGNPAFRKNADEDGFVKARIILTPSRSLALSNPQVKRYYGSPIVSDVVRFRVDYYPEFKKIQFNDLLRKKH